MNYRARFKSYFIFELLITIVYLSDILIKKTTFFQPVAFMLIYLSLKMVYYIFHQSMPKVYLWLLLLLSFFIGLNFNIPLYYYLPLILVQVQLPILLNAIGFLPLFFLQGDYTYHYALILIFCLPSGLMIDFWISKSSQLSESVKRLSQEMNQIKKEKHLMDAFEQSINYSSRLEEREKVAQKLHDTLGHVLTGSTMQLEAALIVNETKPDQSVEMIQSTIDHLRNGSDAIRQILKDIQPEKAQVNMAQLTKLIKETENQTNIKFTLNYDHLVESITYYQWQMIYINIQEAITNMIKYASASECMISFEHLSQHVKVTCKDNGVGTPHVKMNMGLKGMSRRLAEINGKLIVDGSDGFSIIMLIPRERKQNV